MLYIDIADFDITQCSIDKYKNSYFIYYNYNIKGTIKKELLRLLVKGYIMLSGKYLKLSGLKNVHPDVAYYNKITDIVNLLKDPLKNEYIPNNYITEDAKYININIIYMKRSYKNAIFIENAPSEITREELIQFLKNKKLEKSHIKQKKISNYGTLCLEMYGFTRENNDKPEDMNNIKYYSGVRMLAMAIDTKLVSCTKNIKNVKIVI